VYARNWRHSDRAAVDRLRFTLLGFTIERACSVGHTATSYALNRRARP
jgi:hypothetical protein